jgi:hypothetical protein
MHKRRFVRKGRLGRAALVHIDRGIVGLFGGRCLLSDRGALS